MAAHGDRRAEENSARCFRLLGKAGRSPDTLAARFSIAQQMAARGDHAGAQAEFRDVLPHLERKLGSPSHAGRPVQYRPADGARGSLGRRIVPRDTSPAAKAGPDHPHSRGAEWIEARKGECLTSDRRGLEVHSLKRGVLRQER